MDMNKYGEAYKAFVELIQRMDFFRKFSLSLNFCGNMRQRAEEYERMMDEARSKFEMCGGKTDVGCQWDGYRELEEKMK